MKRKEITHKRAAPSARRKAAHTLSVREIRAKKEQQKEIAASRALLMSVFQASRDVIAVVDPADFSLISFNNSFEDLIFKTCGVRARTGMRPEDVAPAQAETWNGFLRQVLAGGDLIRDYELPGLNVTHQISAHTLESDGRIYGICIFGHDITDRKQMEAALCRSEEKFAKAFREAPLALSITSLRDNRIIEVNDHYLGATGYTREELLGKTSNEVGIWVQPDARADLLKQLQETGEVRNFELLYRTKAAEIRLAVGSVAQIEIGDEPCMLATIMDITERKRALQALRESEERLRIAIEAGHMYAFEWNVATGEVERSEQCARILDFIDAGATHTKQQLIDRILPEDRQQYLSVLESIKPEKPAYKTVFRLRLKNGRIIWLEESGQGIFEPDGKLQKVIGITSDVTEARESEATLRELSGRLINSQEEERRRIARELHDHIGQEAALICVQAQRLDSGTAEEEQTTHSDVHELYRRMKVLSADISTLSHRLHSSELTFLGLAIAGERLCLDIASQYAIDVDCRIKPLPSNLDSAKSLCLYRVMEEALQNAVKHSHARQVSVQLEARGSELALTVADNGDGFEFEKANLGLGLLSMRERLHLVGGRFTILSKPGSGTKVVAHVAV